MTSTWLHSNSKRIQVADRRPTDHAAASTPTCTQVEDRERTHQRWRAVVGAPPPDGSERARRDLKIPPLMRIAVAEPSCPSGRRP